MDRDSLAATKLRRLRVPRSCPCFLSQPLRIHAYRRPRQNPSRYVLYGDVSARAAQMLRDPEVEHFFTRLIQRVAPKSYVQGACVWACLLCVGGVFFFFVMHVVVGRSVRRSRYLLIFLFLTHAAKGEVTICRVFFENFSGDQVRQSVSQSVSQSKPTDKPSTRCIRGRGLHHQLPEVYKPTCDAIHAPRCAFWRGRSGCRGTTPARSPTATASPTVRLFARRSDDAVKRGDSRMNGLHCRRTFRSTRSVTLIPNPIPNPSAARRMKHPPQAPSPSLRPSTSHSRSPSSRSWAPCTWGTRSSSRATPRCRW
jgi:hypothetical protein